MVYWQNSLIRSHATLEIALSKIDQAACRILLVSDENNRLLGTITDGDIRRSLLNGAHASLKVTEVMNTNPKFAVLSDSKQAIISKMKQYSIHQIPLIDDAGVIIGLKLIDELVSENYTTGSVLIMAGGFGKRLRPLTDNCPKPMLKLGNKPILERIILNCKNAGYRHFYISTHFLSHVITDYFGNGTNWDISIEYLHEKNPLGTGGAVSLLPSEKVTNPLLVMNGDLLTSLDIAAFVKFHAEKSSRISVCVREMQNKVPFGVMEGEGTKLKSITEKPTHKFLVNAGIYLLQPDVLKMVKLNEKIDMPDLLMRCIEDGGDVNMYTLHEQWLDIGRMNDFERAQSLYSESSNNV